MMRLYLYAYMYHVKEPVKIQRSLKDSRFQVLSQSCGSANVTRARFSASGASSCPKESYTRFAARCSGDVHSVEGTAAKFDLTGVIGKRSEGELPLSSLEGVKGEGGGPYCLS